MRRLWTVLAALALMAAACGDDTSALTPRSTEETTTTAPATTEAPTSTAPPTTEAPTTTTSSSTTTTTMSATTTTTTVAPAPVTTHASVPGGAMGRHLVPWADVGDDWVLALYSGDQVYGGFADGPTVLYLAGPQGDLYEITAWAAGSREPYEILDWSPDGERALLKVGPSAPPDDDRRIVLVDLATGARSTFLTFAETVWETDAAFTSPTGTNVVVGTDDGTTEHLEVHRAGASNAVLVDRPSETDHVYWLYGQAGTSVVVSDVDGIRLLDNQGALIRTLDTPGFDCRVPRWWGSHMVLAACVPPAEWAAGNYYHQLWLVPDDGSAAVPMSTVPGGIIVVDFGLLDAREVGGDTVVQWSGDCSAGSLQILQPDGSGTGIPTAFPIVVAGVEMITPQGPRIAVRYWDDCGQTQGWLGQIRLDGTYTRDLVPVVTDRAGVLSAVGMD